jgi:type VI secretion system secreted protein VgrG
VHGTQTAVVTGPAGEEIHTDIYGRVKVHFHWDRVSAMDDKSSCWVRISQGWAGKNWGMSFLPRVGQEVIVDFLEGDPDHPIITGRVHNAEAMPPYELPANKTISGVKTRSSRGAGADQLNVIRFEDKKGEEQLFVQAERNLDIRVKNDAFETVKADHHLVVECDRLERVGNNRDEKVGADHKESIGKDRHLRVAGKEAIDVTGSRSLTVTGDVIEVCKGAHSRKTTMDDSLSALGVVINATKGITLKCGSNSIVLDTSGISISGNLLTFDGKLTRINSGPGSPPSSAVAGSAVRPAAPAQAEEADTDDPADTAALRAEQQKSNKGKYGTTKAPPHKPDPALVAQQAPLPEGPAGQPPAQEEPETTWIEIELVDCDDNPIAGESYEIELPDGSVAAGTTDEKGLARVVGFEPGDCKITFPNLDKDAWEPA